ncbi:hypothetical protein F4775DRAFT_340860 [Biscogniauxia sp. FL1348]|nr:hypothetical protein F4775DRAFT_340860 [Biscogniauxia sp. FL1348]
MAGDEPHAPDTSPGDSDITGTSISNPSEYYSTPDSDANIEDTSVSDILEPDAFETSPEHSSSNCEDVDSEGTDDTDARKRKKEIKDMEAFLKELSDFRSSSFWSEPPPNRKRLLSPSLDRAERERVITDRIEVLEGLWNVMVYPDYEYKHWSVENLKKVLYKGDVLWNASQCCKDLQQGLLELVTTGGILRVTQIICFGLGPITPDVPREKWSAVQANKHERVVFQHAAAVTISKFFSKVWQTKVPVMACDIAYQRKDIEALAWYGIDATNGSENSCSPYLAINEETLVFSIGCYPAMQQIVMETTRPAAMLWSQPLAKHFQLLNDLGWE